MRNFSFIMASAKFTNIGNFKVILSEKLGKGGFGIVYKARDSRGKDVAAKEIHMDEHGEAATKEAANFYKLKPIKHQNIVDILDIKQVERVAWIFMELCPLGDLIRYFREHFRDVQADHKKVELMTQISDGIEFLHKSSIVHRDIKPANILLSPSGTMENVIVKLTDFGLTKFLDPNGTASTMSTAEGTPFFMAPEFWNEDDDGNIHYNWSVDIFAAGLAFLAMIQNTQGKPLLPQIENTDDRKYTRSVRMTIGQAMLMRDNDRKPDLRIVENMDGDSPMIKAVKRLIKQMTCVRAEYRCTASQVRAQLQTIHQTTPSQLQVNPELRVTEPQVRAQLQAIQFRVSQNKPKSCDKIFRFHQNFFWLVLDLGSSVGQMHNFVTCFRFILGHPTGIHTPQVISYLIKSRFPLRNTQNFPKMVKIQNFNIFNIAVLMSFI